MTPRCVNGLPVEHINQVPTNAVTVESSSAVTMHCTNERIEAADVGWWGGWPSTVQRLDEFYGRGDVVEREPSPGATWSNRRRGMLASEQVYRLRALQ